MRELQADELRAFVIAVARHLLANQPSSSSMLESLEESVASSTSLPGLRDAARDMMEWSQDLHGQSLRELDEHLSASGLPTLTEMRAT
jgi:hypothetical protein